MQMNQNMQQSEQHSALACPTCSTTRLYQLADGRMKCAICRRVFSIADHRHTRLSQQTRDELAKAFWEMSGTADTAARLELNIKTVQKYFSMLRENLANQSQRALFEQLGTEKLTPVWFEGFPQRSGCGNHARPLAAIVRTDGGISLLQVVDHTPEPSFSEQLILGWLYAQDEESKQRLNLDKIHCQTRDSDSIVLTAPFWRFVKQGLVHYQGGFRHNFFQYLREMEFRYNDRENLCGPELCLHHLAVA